VTERTPLDGVDLLLADLDGVVYRGSHAIPHAVESLNRASSSCALAYVTNNASRTPESVAEQLAGFGLDVSRDDIVTSSQAAVRLLADLIPPGSRVLVVGGDGLHAELTLAGFEITESADDSPAAVIQGFAPEVGWVHLAEAAYALQGEGNELPWVATNTDWTIPRARGIAPGNGTLVSAVHLAVGRLPVVAGKPETPIFQAAIARFGGTKTLFIGDRLDTDILGANRAGIESVMVLTGVDQAKQILAADPNSRPTFILENLSELDKPYPHVQVDVSPDGARVVTVGNAVVQLVGTVVSIVSKGESTINLLRAGSAAIWGSGLAIYGLNVDPELYS